MTGMRRAALVGCLIGLGSGALAQEPDTAAGPLAGRPVRFKIKDDQPLEARLVRLDDDSLVVRQGRDIRAIPRGELSRLDIGRDDPSLARRRAVWGGVIGGVAGLAAAVFGKCDASSTEECAKGLERAAVVPLGAGLGALIGAGTSKHWKAIPPLPEGPRFIPAQRLAAVLAGRWVRLRAGEVAEGRVVRIDRDTLVLALDGRAADTVALPRSTISAMWLRAGRWRRTRPGMTIGATTGALVIPGIWAASVGDPWEPLAWVFLGPPCALLGGAVGAAIGAGVVHEHWQPLAQPAVTVEPAGRGRLAFALRVGV